jgi:hypothetical protein
VPAYERRFDRIRRELKVASVEKPIKIIEDYETIAVGKRKLPCLKWRGVLLKRKSLLAITIQNLP